MYLVRYEGSSLEISGKQAKSKQMRSGNQNGSSTSGEYEPKPGSGPKRLDIVPHWNAILVLVAIGVLYAFLPEKVSIGPSWLLLAVEGVFIVARNITNECIGSALTLTYAC